MDNREYIVRCSSTPITPVMIIEENGHTYVYDHFEVETHYLTMWYNYYYKLEK